MTRQTASSRPHSSGYTPRAELTRWPSGPARLVAAGMLVLALAGCASLAQRTPTVEGPRTVAGPMSEALDRWEDSPRVESITRYGISLSAPAGFGFEAPAGGAVVLDSVPWGMLLVITGGQQTVEGSLQVVPVEALTGTSDPEPGALSALAYLETYGLAGEELSTGSSIPGELTAPVAAAAVEAGGLARHLVAGIARFPAGYADHLAVLVEIWTPRNDSALIQHAASIIASLRLPGSDEAAAVSARSRGRGALEFRDGSGTWVWVMDTASGFALRRQTDEADVYVMLDAPADYPAGQLEATPQSLEVGYGRLVWDTPLAELLEQDTPTWVARVPGAGLPGETPRADLQLSVAVPARGWRDGRVRTLEQPPIVEIQPLVQELLDGPLLLR